MRASMWCAPVMRSSRRVGAASRMSMSSARICGRIPIFLASANERFQLTYPFYKLAEGEGAWPNLVRWELIYFNGKKKWRSTGRLCDSARRRFNRTVNPSIFLFS